jgi:hypothetical protein
MTKDGRLSSATRRGVYLDWRAGRGRDSLPQAAVTMEGYVSLGPASLQPQGDRLPGPKRNWLAPRQAKGLRAVARVEDPSQESLDLRCAAWIPGGEGFAPALNCAISHPRAAGTAHPSDRG